jgi:precorrin-6B methylase 1
VQVVEFIKMHSSSYGKAKIVLKNNQYFIEAVDRPTMNRLISFECVRQGINDFVVEEQLAAEEAKRN